MRITRVAVAEEAAVVELRVDGHGRAGDGGTDDDGEHTDRQQLLAPVAAEQPPAPAADGATGRAHAGSPAGEERLRPGGRQRLVDEAAVAEEHDTVGPRRQLRLVGDDDAGRAAAAHVAQQAHHRLAVDRVERAGRFVGQHQAALADDARAMATRWRSPPDRSSGKCSARSAQAELARAPSRATAAGLAGRGAVELERHRHVLDRGEPGEQVEVLEHEPDRRAGAAGPVAAADMPADGGAVDDDLAARRLLERAGDRQQGALARSARAHDGHQLAGRDRQVDLAQRVHGGGAVAVDLGDARELEHGAHDGPSGRRRAAAARRFERVCVGRTIRRRGRQTAGAGATSALSSQRTAASMRNSSASTTSASATSSALASALTAV